MIDHGVDVQVWIFHSTRFHLRIRVSCTFQKEGTCWSNLNKRLTSLKKMDHWLEMEDDHCHIKSPNSNWRAYIPKTLKKLWSEDLYVSDSCSDSDSSYSSDYSSSSSLSLYLHNCDPPTNFLASTCDVTGEWAHHVSANAESSCWNTEDTRGKVLTLKEVAKAVGTCEGCNRIPMEYPKELRRIERMQHHFFIGGKENSKPHLINWKIVSQPKRCGCLALGELHKRNSTLQQMDLAFSLRTICSLVLYY